MEKKVGTKHRTDEELLPSGDEITGRVKWFNTGKGYGFIEPEAGGPDVFVHITAVKQAGIESLTDNQSLTFILVKDRYGRAMASNLKVED